MDENDNMVKLTHLTLDDDEIAVLVDALQADIEDYDDAAKEANDEGDLGQAREYALAAQRVLAVLQKVRGASND
jgi:hypothetical protein